MTRWICVTSRDNAEISRKTNVWGVSNRYKNKIQQVQPGDTLLMYVPGVLNENIPSEIIDAYEVTSDLYNDTAPLFVTSQKQGKEIFPLRLQLKPLETIEKPIIFKPLIPKISFIKNKTYWSAYFRRAMILISEDDYQTILSAR